MKHLIKVKGQAWCGKRNAAVKRDGGFAVYVSDVTCPNCKRNVKDHAKRMARRFHQ